jgi:biopolymer transport protein ExbD
MRLHKTRMGDATFELNLAPFLDIIVSIVPMLLLSIAFVQIKMIESPTPQMVSQDQVTTPPKPETTVTLHVSMKTGLFFEIVDEKGKKDKVVVDGSTAGTLNYAGLVTSALGIKAKYPQLTKLQMAPEGDVPFDDLVQIMDKVREKPRLQTGDVSFTDKAIDAKAENRQMFPEIIFSSVGG